MKKVKNNKIIPYLRPECLVFVASLLLFMGSCKKLIEIDPPIQSIVKEKVFNNTANASAVLIGLYHDMAQGTTLSFSTGANSLSVNLGLYADELVYFNGFNQFYTNSLSEEQDNYWSELYAAIFRANSAIEGISESSSLIPEVKQRLIGEAKFLRAFYYFYLVNIFGDVPLVITTDYGVTGVLPRATVSAVYEQVILDLKEAQELLGDNYVGADILVSSSERTRPNKWAATALLARVYLYDKQWQKAQFEASKLIAATDNYHLTGPDSIFLKNSKEAIWQLQPVVTTYANTLDAYYFIPPSTVTLVNVYINEHLHGGFDPHDIRKTNWMQEYNGLGIYYPFKYKIATYNGIFEEYLMVLRLGEQYLIRAEARAHVGDLDGAKEDLYEIRKRAGLLDPVSAVTQEEILTAVIEERQKELFTEWGHRFFDIKRIGKADKVLSELKPSSWETYKQLFPIPKTEIQKNPSLTGHQNHGY